MNVFLRPVERDHLRALIRLRVSEDQQDFVASNAVSLAQAPYETGAYPFGIWKGGEAPVGFLSLIDCREHLYLEDGDDPNSVFLWRMMVAHDHQAKGLGKSAMQLVFQWVQNRGLPKIVTSAVESNVAALGFYEGLGFARTGRVIDGEVELSRTI